MTKNELSMLIDLIEKLTVDVCNMKCYRDCQFYYDNGSVVNGCALGCILNYIESELEKE